MRTRWAICMTLGAASSMLLSVVGTVGAAEPGGAKSPYAAWRNGPLKDPVFFPLAVWLQAPGNAGKYKAIGINTYVGLWQGPTEDQLAALKKAGIRVVCAQNSVGLKHLDDPMIIAWMHGDEPDNAQALPGGKGYGPPIAAGNIVEAYRKLSAADPTRPVLLNLGQGVAWDGYVGRGVRTNHPEDYEEYLKGGDIVSFDIYPAVHDNAAVKGKLWMVPQGVDRLRKWGGPGKIVWNCIEASRISNPNRKPTPHEMRAEVWMSLIHGSQGIIYFCHQFKPKFIEAGLLAEADLAEAVGAINRQILELAPVLNSPTIADRVQVRSSDRETPIDAMVKQSGGALYIFAACMRDDAATVEFELAQAPAGASVEVIGEGRTLEAKDGKFSDAFKGFEVHLYRVGGR